MKNQIALKKNVYYSQRSIVQKNTHFWRLPIENSFFVPGEGSVPEIPDFSREFPVPLSPRSDQATPGYL